MSLLSKKHIGYFIYCLLVTTLLLYLLFPNSLLPAILQRAIRKANLPFYVIIDKAYLSSIAKVNIPYMKIVFKKEPYFLVEVQKATFTPSLSSLLTGKIRCFFKAVIYNGKIKGDFQLLGGKDKMIKITANIKNIYIGKQSYIQNMLNRKIFGKISGQLIYKGSVSKYWSGEGKGHFIWTDGAIQLRNNIPFLDFNFFYFNNMDITYNFKHKRIYLQDIKLKSKEFSGYFKGKINIKGSFLKSSVDLNGKIKLLPYFRERISHNNTFIRKFLLSHCKNNYLNINIYGTIKEPRIRFL